MTFGSVYGRKQFGTEINEGRFHLRLDRNYFRSVKNLGHNRSEVVEKVVVGGSSYIVNPVEPVNLPVEITRMLFIEFSKPVNVEPKSAVRVYLKFPVEIGVFVEGKRIRNIDVFTLSNPKFALYGNPSRGVVCRYYSSDVYDTIPDVDGVVEGVMELTIENNFDEWVEVRRAVFDGYGMKIYFSNYPAMVAVMRIESASLAETMFINKPLEDGMEKSIELYTARRFIERKKFSMEWGI